MRDLPRPSVLLVARWTGVSILAGLFVRRPWDGVAEGVFVFLCCLIVWAILHVEREAPAAVERLERVSALEDRGL